MGVKVSLLSIATVNKMGMITDIFVATEVVETPTLNTLWPINLNMVMNNTPRNSDKGIQLE